MRKGLAVAALLAAALGASPSVAFAAGTDGVQVRGGRTFRGTVVEVRPRVLVRIRLDDGAEMTVPWTEVIAVRGPDGEPLPSAVAADPGPKSETPDRPRHWYGWQTLLVDAGSVVLMPFAGVGFVTYAVGPPAVHAAHGRAGPALGSFLMRVSLPLALAGIGVALADAGARSDPDSNSIATGPIFGALTGLIIGVMGSMAIDDAAIAWEPVKSSAPAVGSGASPGVAMAPWVTVTGDAEHRQVGWMGIVGSF